MATPVQKKDDCGKCGSVVSAREKGVRCDICKYWFHTRCQDVSDDTYKVLQKDKAVHWYCVGCGRAAIKIFETLGEIQTKQRELEEEVKKMNSEMNEVKLKMEIVCKDSEELKKTIQDLNDKLEVEKIKEAVDEQLHGVDTKIMSVNDTLEQVRSKALEERDRENRACNIIMYNVTESKKTLKEDRWRDDRKLCLDLFNKVLEVPIREEDIKRFLRLGRMDEASKPRPVLIQFRDRILKNMIMESLSKLKEAENEFKNIIFAHDMTRNERQECKTLVEEAKKKQSEDTSGEYIYRVRGTPGNLRIDRIRKRH